MPDNHFFKHWRRAFLQLCSVLVCACAVSASASGRQYICVVDTSVSRDSFQQEEALQYLKSVVRQLDFEDRLVILKMQQSGLADHNKPFVQTMPGSRGVKANRLDYSDLEDKKATVSRLLPVIVRPAANQKVVHTDIFSTLHLVSEYSADSQGRRTVLILLSDMLQSTSEFEMQGLRRMPQANWIEGERRRDRLPSLENVCVNVVGADTATTAGTTVRKFWNEYFRATGAVLLAKDYRAVAPSNPDISCGGS